MKLCSFSFFVSFVWRRRHIFATFWFEIKDNLKLWFSFSWNFIVIEIRFPLMESNMEARMGNTNGINGNNISNSTNKINDINYFHGGRYSVYTSNGNNTVLVRPNASLPRKLHNRVAYYGYSHGKSHTYFILREPVCI